MRLSSRSVCAAAAFCMSLALSGCGLWPWGEKTSGTLSAGQPTARAPYGERSERASPAPRSSQPGLPIRGSLAVYVDPKVFSTRSVSSYGLDEKIFNERSMVEKAALTSFRRVFAQVGPYQEGKDTDATLSLTGDSYYNPIMRTYYVNVRGSMYIGEAADSIGTFKSKAQFDGAMNDPDAFLRAYTMATDDIARQIVASPEFAEAIKVQ